MPTSTSRDVFGSLHDGIQQAVQAIANERDAAGTPRVELTRPSNAEFGDLASNVALLLAPVVRSDPRSVATELASRIQGLAGVANVDVAGPGFVNLHLDDAWYVEAVAALRAADDSWGRGALATTENVQVEFVSANPTGPITAASARHAAYGDSLTRLMRYAGDDVETEYYVNDAGRQIQLFGESILAMAAGTDVPEGGYQGAYVGELAREIDAQADSDPGELGSRGVERMLERIRTALGDFRVTFDRFQSEAELHAGGAVTDAVARLESTGHTYMAEGATWLRTTSFGDDKDRVLVRPNGQPTYFAADVAYIESKFSRGYDRCIYVLGADHHGYIARLKAAAQALGHDPDRLEVVMMQLVHLIEGGEQKKMSKRRGDIVTIDELVARIGVDAARFFMLQRSHDQTLDLDLDLAVEAAPNNPVYYVQYAHARICSIMAKAVGEGFTVPAPGDEVSCDSALEAAERALVMRLGELPHTLRTAVAKRAPHRVAHYAHDLASDFAQFYRDCRVIGDGVTPSQTTFRLHLAAATRTTLARCLDICGVSAPERM